jgi:hypothetical protein
MLPILLIAACDQVFGLESRVPADAAGPLADAPDAPLDARDTFDEPALVTLACPAGRTAGDPSLDLDEKVFAYTCASGADGDLYEAPRMSLTQGGTATMILATAASEGSPELSPDGKQLYYLTFPSKGVGQINLKQRATIGDAWGVTMVRGDLNAPGDNRPGSPNQAGNHMVISRGGALVEVRSNGTTWMSLSATGTLGAITAAVNPHLSVDGLTLVFAARSVNLDQDLYIARRDVLGGAWGAAVPISELNTSFDEAEPWLSADQRRLYFARQGLLFLARK